MSRNDAFGDVVDPFGEIDTVETTYQPPTNLATWARAAPPSSTTGDAPTPSVLEDDEPFTAAHLAAATQTIVPAVGPVAQPQQPPLVAPIPFAAQVQSPSNLSGRVGDAAIPPAASNLNASVASGDDTMLLGNAASSSAAAPSEAPGASPFEDPSSFPFYNIKRYRTYFNVDTEEVLHRIFRAVVMFFKGDFLENVGANPDLWGPFWIASTLVFVSAAAGNTASYIAFRKASGAVPPAPPGTQPAAPAAWYYDVDKVGGSMGLFYGYVGVIGLALWMALRWFRAEVSLPHVWCAYGYSMAAFVPMAALCVLPMESARWALVMVATAASGTFLFLNFRPTIMEAAGAKAVPLLLVMLGLHAVLGLALKLYFFRYS